MLGHASRSRMASCRTKIWKSDVSRLALTLVHGKSAIQAGKNSTTPNAESATQAILSTALHSSNNTQSTSRPRTCGSTRPSSAARLPGQVLARTVDAKHTSRQRISTTPNASLFGGFVARVIAHGMGFIPRRKNHQKHGNSSRDACSSSRQKWPLIFGQAMPLARVKFRWPRVMESVERPSGTSLKARRGANDSSGGTDWSAWTCR